MFRGTGTALITPFKKGRVDFESLERLVEFQIRNGVDFLVVLGTTGEATTISSTEKKEDHPIFRRKSCQKDPHRGWHGLKLYANNGRTVARGVVAWS